MDRGRKVGNPANATRKAARGAFLSSAFPYHAEQDCFTCPAGKTLTHHATQKRANGLRIQEYRAPKAACRKCALRSQCAPPKARPAWVRSIGRSEEPAATVAFKAKMATEEAKQIYAQRSRLAEFPHAWIKERCGLRQFRCRGLLKATLEATWAALSYNLTRWFALRRQARPHPSGAGISLRKEKEEIRGKKMKK